MMTAPVEEEIRQGNTDDRTAFRRQLRSIADFATLVSKLQPEDGRQIYRIFKVYHPVLEAETNITVQEISDSYHIIEKFMDILVCGNTKTAGKIARIKNKEELLRLLGIDYEAYEIASLYFDDLVESGHFRVEADGIYPCRSAIASVESIDMQSLGTRVDGSVDELLDIFADEDEASERVKLDRKYIERQVYSKKLFDQYSRQLMPACFYGAEGFLSTPEQASEKALNNETVVERNAVWLAPVSTVLDAAVDLEMGINGVNDRQGKTHYENGLPQGFAGMQLVSGTELALRYCPYYLVVYIRQDGTLQYAAHDLLKGEQIPFLSENYNHPAESGYVAAVQLIRELCETTEHKSVQSPIFATWPIQIRGKTVEMFGYTQQKDGNFCWTMQPWQLPVLVQMCKNQKKRMWIQYALRNTYEVMSNYLAGRMVKIQIADEYRQVLQQELQKPCEVDETPDIEEKMDSARVLLIKKLETAADALAEIANACPEACFWLGYIHEEKKDYDQALLWYLQAADGGYVPALAFAAKAMELASTRPENARDAGYYLNLAKEKGFDCTGFESAAKPAPAELAAQEKTVTAAEAGTETPAAESDPEAYWGKCTVSVQADSVSTVLIQFRASDESCPQSHRLFDQYYSLFDGASSFFPLPSALADLYIPNARHGIAYRDTLSLTMERDPDKGYVSKSLLQQDLDVNYEQVEQCPSVLQLLNQGEDVFEKFSKTYRAENYDPAKIRYAENRELIDRCCADPAFAELKELLATEFSYKNRRELIECVQTLIEQASDNGNALMQYLFYCMATDKVRAISFDKKIREEKKEKAIEALKQAAQAGLSVAMIRYADLRQETGETLHYLQDAAQNTGSPWAYYKIAAVKRANGMLSDEEMAAQLKLCRQMLFPAAFYATDDEDIYASLPEYAHMTKRYAYGEYLLRCGVEGKQEMLKSLRSDSYPNYDPWDDREKSKPTPNKEQREIIATTVRANLAADKMNLEKVLSELKSQKFLPVYRLAYNMSREREHLAKCAVLGGCIAARKLGEAIYKENPDAALRCYRFAASRGNAAAAKKLAAYYLKNATSDADLLTVQNIFRSLIGTDREGPFLAYAVAFRFGTDVAAASDFAGKDNPLLYRLLDI